MNIIVFQRTFLDLMNLTRFYLFGSWTLFVILKTRSLEIKNCGNSLNDFHL
jgi:hypothetical protein